MDSGPAAALLLLGALARRRWKICGEHCELALPTRVAASADECGLDFSAGIPAEHRTLVAVPALLTSERTGRDLVEQIELRYLANKDENLSFALLSDFPDADQETVPGDFAAGLGPYGDRAAQRALSC